MMGRAETRTARTAKRAVGNAAAGLQDLIESADELLSDLHDQQGAAVNALRKRVSHTAAVARRRLDRLSPVIADVASDTLDGAVGFVRRDPWRSVAIGAVAVLLLSMFARFGSED